MPHSHCEQCQACVNCEGCNCENLFPEGEDLPDSTDTTSSEISGSSQQSSPKRTPLVQHPAGNEEDDGLPDFGSFDATGLEDVILEETARPDVTAYKPPAVTFVMTIRYVIWRVVVWLVFTEVN
jgi:hypothetical protein